MSHRIYPNTAANSTNNITKQNFKTSENALLILKPVSRYTHTNKYALEIHFFNLF